MRLDRFSIEDKERPLQLYWKSIHWWIRHRVL